MENKHKLFILGLLLSLCLCGCGKTSDQKSDFEYQLLDGWVENKVDNTLFFTPNAYKVGSEATCAKYMISAGYIQKFNTSDDWGKIKDGKIQQVYFDNHSNVEDYGQVDGLCAPGYLIKVDYDLYSAAALEKEKNNGTNILEIRNENIFSSSICIFFSAIPAKRLHPPIFPIGLFTIPAAKSTGFDTVAP